jgi:hypothetical protein
MSTTTGTARRAANSDAVNTAARVGFAAKGLVYALIGVLALQVAFGDSQQADQVGALRSVADKPGGTVVLWLVVLGFLGYALWRFSEAAWGRRDETDERKRAAKRLGSLANGLLYLAFAALALRILTSGSGGGGGQSLTARVLDWPGGQVLVGAAGLAVLVVGGALTWRGLSTDFQKHLDTGRMRGGLFRWVRRLGQVGYAARGVVFALAGIFVVRAAMEHEPGKAEGLDVALKSVADAPFGPALLTGVAAGLVCFGAYCFAEARYRRL